VIGLLRRFELDAGIIYLEGQDTEGLRVTPLYSERQVLMAAPGLLTAHDGPVTWPEVFGLPLWELADADVVISQPFWPAYLTADRIAKAPSLKLAITAGIGSDHVDLDAAINAGITVAEVTYCNSISVAEHAVMQVLALVRNFLPAHDWVTAKRGWHIADSAARAYDLEGMDVGVIAAGRIGQAVLRRLAPSTSGCTTLTRAACPPRSSRIGSPGRLRRRRLVPAAAGP
jgi:hypothetical protein